MILKKIAEFDSSVEVLTPEGIKFNLIPAGLPVRTLAYAIDVLAQWIILIVIYIVWGLLRWRFGLWIFFLLNFCLDWFYHVICELLFHGRSIGKRITGIRVVKSDGSPVDPAGSFLRNLLRFADTFCYFFPIAFLSMSISSGFRRIGDWAGNTIVVYTRTGSFKKNTAEFLVKYPSIIPPVVLSYNEKQAILNFARRYPLLGESRANEIAGVYAQHIRAAPAGCESGRSGEDNILGSAFTDGAQNDYPEISDAAYLLGIARYLSGAVSAGYGGEHHGKEPQ